MTAADVFQNAAVRILLQYKRSLTLTQNKTAQVYDPGSGDSTEPATVSFDFIGAIVKYSDRLVNGTTILAMDRQCYIAGKGLKFEPQIGDIVTTKTGDIYRVLNRYLHEVSDQNILWQLQLRR